MNKKKENYLDKIPCRNENYKFSCDEKGIVTIEVENKGVFNRIAQKLLKKPKVSYVHFDEFGSFVWCATDGESDVFEIGKRVEERFGEKAHPLYERLSKFYMILESYGFVKFKK
jgi:hypothetical protein